MLYYAIVALHIIVCAILVLVVLLQSGKGADLAGAFGGGATQTAFGSRGPASFLSRMTTVAAVVFMITSISLSMMVTNVAKKEAKSILETTGTEAAQPQPDAQKPESGTKSQEPVPTPEQIRKIQQEYESRQKQNAVEPAPQPEPAK